MHSFDEAYKRLNDAQRKAVDSIEGPVMVVAGPGTGKTQVVAMRVANILKKTQMKPYNILCMTFSNSGATAMRERLRSLIGPDAYGVTVSTIHGFCNYNVLQAFPEVFDDFAQIDHATDVQRFQLMNELIDELPVGSVIINPKNRYDRTPGILSRISQVKREGVSLDHLKKAAAEYRSEMEQKSKPTTKAHKRNLRLAQQCEEFVGLFARYLQEMKARGFYDYDDMLLMVIDALKTEDWLIASLQERFQYILVDEFQDTNGAQNRLIELLTTLPEGTGQPNLFAVGDDDQAIYRFQGASVTTMTDFVKRFPGCPIITLTKSYRSTQEILDSAEELISKNEDRLVGKVPGLSKHLESAIGEPHGNKPMLMRPVSDAIEGFAIAERIKEFVAQGIELNDIAVFTRTNHELFDLYDVLRTQNIPSQITGKLDLLRQPKVLELLAMLSAINDPTSDATLAAGISCAVFDCHPADLGSLWALQRERNYARRDEGKSWIPLIDTLSALDKDPAVFASLGFRKSDDLLMARDLLLNLSNKQATLTLPDLVEQLLRKSHLLPETQEDIIPLEYIALQEFFEYVKRRCHEQNTFTLKHLLQEIAYRQRYGLRLTYSVPHLVDDAVQLMTAHGSKGLEFDVVFIAGFREKHWDHKRGSTTLSLPDHLLFAGEDESDLSLEDERKLTFVAWTRARRHLILSCPERITRGDREQDISPSQFFSEAGKLPEVKHEISNPDTIALMRPALDIDMDEALQTFLRKKLETFELSVTALNNFLADPQKFLWDDLLSAPKAKEPQFAYGSAVHSALREWGTNAQKNTLIELPAFIDAFKAALDIHEVLSDRDRKYWHHIGEESLPRYYQERLLSLPIIAGLEKRISGRLGDIRLKGILDRFDLYHVNGKNVHVIDYKTGTPKTEKQVKEDWGGSTYRQLVFYKLLSDLSPDFGGYEATEFSLDFIGEGENNPRRLIFEIPQKEVEELKDVIKRVWAKIIALDFTPLP